MIVKVLTIHLTYAEQRRDHVEARSSAFLFPSMTIDAFCYHYDDVSVDFGNLIAGAGYDTATTTWNGRARSKDNSLLLPLKMVRRTDERLGALRKCVIC